jgi:hypothetical protein
MKKLLILPFLLVTILSATAQTDFQALILNHQVEHGMTFADVAAAWGNPQKTLHVDAAKPTAATDAWTYPQAVVLFSQGRVSCIHMCEPEGK